MSERITCPFCGVRVKNFRAHLKSIKCKQKQALALIKSSGKIPSKDVKSTIYKKITTAMLPVSRVSTSNDVGWSVERTVRAILPHLTTFHTEGKQRTEWVDKKIGDVLEYLVTSTLDIHQRDIDELTQKTVEAQQLVTKLEAAVRLAVLSLSEYLNEDGTLNEKGTALAVAKILRGE